MQTSAAADDFRVVCLGGSAGGLQAYMDILRGLPANSVRQGECLVRETPEGMQLSKCIIR